LIISGLQSHNGVDESFRTGDKEYWPLLAFSDEKQKKHASEGLIINPQI